MGRVAAAVFVGAILFVGVYAASAAYADAGTTYNSTESFQADPGTVTVFNHSNRDAFQYGKDPLVQDENGTVLVEGEDYEWYHRNGTLKTLSGGRLSDGETATITYRYAVPSTYQRKLNALVMPIWSTIADSSVLVLFVAAAIVATARLARG